LLRLLVLLRRAAAGHGRRRRAARVDWFRFRRAEPERRGRESRRGRASHTERDMCAHVICQCPDYDYCCHLDPLVSSCDPLVSSWDGILSTMLM
jgi:hypothetical protein